MRRRYVRIKLFKNGEAGVGLTKVVLTILILGVIGAGLAMTATTASKTLVANDRMEAARNYAQYVMEYIKGLSYQEVDSYTLPSPPDVYREYGATNEVVSLASGKQKITVHILYGGKEIYELEGYKIK